MPGDVRLELEEFRTVTGFSFALRTDPFRVEVLHLFEAWSFFLFDPCRELALCMQIVYQFCPLPQTITEYAY